MAKRRRRRTTRLTPQQKASKRAKQLRDLTFKVKMAELKRRMRDAGG